MVVIDVVMIRSGNFNHFKISVELYHKFVNGCQATVEGQGHFTQRLLPKGIPPVV